jgi:Flp pilus assembly protein TadG
MSIEFVIMLPLFVVMLSGVVDLSKVYIDQSNAYSVARDTARLVARHAMDAEAAEVYARARASTFTSGTPTASVSVANSRVTVTVTAPNAVLAKFDFLKSLVGTSTTATVAHAMEPI